jgi:hypothetical protein
MSDFPEGFESIFGNFDRQSRPIKKEETKLTVQELVDKLCRDCDYHLSKVKGDKNE